MAKKNSYLQKKADREQAMLEIGIDSGMQRCLDYLTLVLRDPRYIGSDIFGLTRIERIFAGIMAYDKEFAEAYTTSREADVMQDRLDRQLREVYGDRLIPFPERQPYIKQMDYKPRKEWTK